MTESSPSADAGREAYFNVPLTAPGSSGSAAEYYVVGLADNLLLRHAQRVPGMVLTPLGNPTLGTDTCEVLNDVLAQRNFTTRFDPSSWLQKMQRDRPAVVLECRRVLAGSGEQAGQFGRELMHRMLDLMTLRRGAAPRMMAGVVGEATNPPGSYEYRASWIEHSGYTGNLLGGPLSGEDIPSLVQYWDGLDRDPRTQLWLSLYSDALADMRWDYRLFRCFNLLEGIAIECIDTGLLPAKTPILDAASTPRLQSNGKKYTTDHARGKVSALLTRTAARTHHALNKFAAMQNPPMPPEDLLWEDVGIWVTVRNDVAHTGSWRENYSGEPSAHAQTRALIASRGHDGTFDAGRGAVVREIRTAIERVLYAALTRRL
jgi:hypothetical protein